MSRAAVLEAIARAEPGPGPQSVHIDVTNGCNAACVTCWDHSPLLDTPRPAAWKRRRLPWERFVDITDQLADLGTVEAVVLSGMGEPLTHPRIYDMIERVKSHGWGLTMLSNLVAADIDRLASLGVDNLLVGVQGASPEAYTAFHPGWTEQHFFTMCRYLRRLHRAGVQVRHVQVINRDTAPEVVEMVRFGRLFSAQRVNFKLASLAEGTQDCAITEEQRSWLLDEGIPAARALAETLDVNTNLDLFERQDFLGNVMANETYFRAALDDLSDLPIVGDVRGMGYFYGIELVKDPETKETFTSDEAQHLLRGFLSNRLAELGLLCRADARGEPVIQLSPPLIAGPTEFDTMNQVIRQALTEAMAEMEGFSS